MTRLDPERVESAIQTGGFLVLRFIYRGRMESGIFKPTLGPSDLEGRIFLYSGTFEQSGKRRHANLSVYWEKMSFVVGKEGWVGNLEIRDKKEAGR